MDRSPIELVIAVALAGYGVYTLLYLPAMFVGPPVPLLILGFTAQAALALLAAVGVGGRRSWVSVALIAFGVSVAVTQLFEVMLGIVPYLRAIAVAVVAIVGALVIAAFVSRRPAGS